MSSTKSYFHLAENGSKSIPSIVSNSVRRKQLIPIGLLVAFCLLCFFTYNPKFIQIPTIKPPTISRPPPSSYLTPQFAHILIHNPNLFILEPYILYRSLDLNEDKFEDLRWRYNLPQEYTWRRNCLTVGVFEDQLKSAELTLTGFQEKTRLLGASGPFDTTSAKTSIHHIFYQNNSTNPIQQLHLVVLYRVKHFLWLGAIPQTLQYELEDNFERNPNRTFVLHYGKSEQIFDQFEVAKWSPYVASVQLPDDVPHFVSQLPTSRYLHCDPEKTTTWFKANNLTINKYKEEASENGFVHIKSFMRKMQMEFWVACGTLLGWYRQCQITPYTTDTDFATWSKYVRARDLTAELKAESRNHGLYLLNRFGEHAHSLEYSFATWTKTEKLDMFFIYQNATHFLLPFHVEPKFAYSEYPKYELCSIELLGYKLLAPCEPEKIIITEYGTEWKTPVSTWSYWKAPRNIGPLLPFKYNVTQHQTYSWKD